MYALRKGLGDAVSAANPVGTGITSAANQALASTPARLPADFPTWCNWAPFADWFKACQVPTLQQIVDAGVSNYGPAATPETIAAGQAAAAEAVQADCNMNPDACQQMQFAASNPYTSAMFGTGTVGQAAGGLEQAVSTAGSAADTIGKLFSSQWTWWIAGAIVAYMVLQPRGRR